MTDIVSMQSVPINSNTQLGQYFTHERGTYIAVYALFLAGSNFLAPILSGFINDGQGWKWVLVRRTNPELLLC